MSETSAMTDAAETMRKAATHAIAEAVVEAAAPAPVIRSVTSVIIRVPVIPIIVRLID
jgi:hypothetical protein